MQGLSGIVHARAAPPASRQALTQALRALEPPAHYTLTDWCDTQDRVAVARLGSGTLAPEPAVCATDDTACLLEGEFREPRSDTLSSSTARLAALYAEHGERCVEHMAGWFTAFVFDRRAARVVIFNDRFGLRPLYYHHDGQRLLFAPNTRILKAAGGLQTPIDPVALAEFLRYQQILDTRSLYEGIRLLPPGSRLIFDIETGALELDTYWRFQDIPLEQPVSREEAVEHGADLVRQALRRAVSGRHRYGVYLSGGLDSRMIVGGLGKQAVGMPVLNYGVPWGSDVVFARRVARAAGARYHHVVPEHPGWTRDFVPFFARASFTPQHYFNGANVAVAPFAAELFDVNLSGIVGDCILGDPAESYGFMRTARDRQSALEGVDHYFTQGHMNPGTIDGKLASMLLVPELAATLDDTALGSLADIVDSYDAAWDRRADLVYMHTRARRGLMNLHHCERSCIEARPVFYDDDLVSFMFSIPFVHRIDHQLQITILNRVTPRLSWLPTSGENVPPLQNRAVVKLFHWWNKLQMLAHERFPWIPDVPSKEISQWPHHTRTDSAAWIETLLLAPDAQISPFVRRDGIRTLLQSQKSGDEVASWALAELVSLELFLELG